MTKEYSKENGHSKFDINFFTLTLYTLIQLDF